MATVMRHAGAVRIDHAMSLARLWLIPHGTPAIDGAYVRYPLSVLLARLAEESQAARCIVIGEDLGVVPPGFQALMEERALHAYKVWFFERDATGLPETRRWPLPALACLGTHDMATVAGWAAARDIDLRERLGVLDAAAAASGAREDAGRGPRAHRRPARRRHATTASLSLAMHAHMAASPCRLAALQIEDALGLEQQVNVPGTIDEYPNWRNRLPVAVEELAEHAGFRAHARRCARRGRDDRRCQMPTATYRVQFREGMDFARAAGIVPYLAELGASHLYASPIFQATHGSTHGYDVTDHRRFDDDLGGMDGFLELSAALKRAGSGLILDIVPNHMAASVQNPWWADVLRHGRDSRYAGHFDIDWDAPNLVLPVLGKPYGDVVEAGELTLGRDGDGYVLRYYEHAFPLSPATASVIAEAAGTDLAAPPDEATLQRLGADRELIHRIHEAQPYRLAYWRLARDGLTNRRFFEISDLVGVRVEEPRVFDDVHRFLFEMIDAGHVHGVRVDHVDGLADPTGYLDRLAREVPRPVPIWVEKILARGETLPDWPVAGTTGYEFTDLVASVVTDPRGVPTLSEGYDAFTGTEHDYDAMRVEAKREILRQNLAAELDLLTGLAEAALADDPSARDWGRDSLRRALIGILVALPVYRTYLAGGPASPADRAILGRLREDAATHAELDEPGAIDSVLDHLTEAGNDIDRRLRTRLQQTSGALMAKAVEDTLFYRYNRLISANEVGGEPDHAAQPPSAFHDFMGRHGGTALNATATHDTKRGEDARMRIAALAELPDAWVGAVAAFDRELAGEGEAAADAEARWLFYQALLGGWQQPADETLRDRAKTYMQKAVREAKRQTSWVAADDEYEAGLMSFVDAAFASPRFLGIFDDLTAPFVETGRRKSLAQLALKLMAPGIPDIYQGTESFDLSFVDPDNRRPVDFAGLREPPDRDEAPHGSRLKAPLMRFGLALRREHARAFPGRDLPPGGDRGRGTPAGLPARGRGRDAVRGRRPLGPAPRGRAARGRPGGTPPLELSGRGRRARRNLGGPRRLLGLHRALRPRLIGGVVTRPLV